MWALLPLLLAAALTVPALGNDVFDVDEAVTLISAGARHIGPYTVAEAAAASSRWPDQGWGMVVAYSLWGRATGWSELAVRALPWLIGLLTLAWVYRFGRALFTARIALTATLLLATSVLFLTYMHVARSYAAAMLCTAIVIWAYWRVPCIHARPVTDPGPPWCWARPGCCTSITWGRCCYPRWRSSIYSSCARSVVGGSRCYCSDWPHCSPCHRHLIC